MIEHPIYFDHNATTPIDERVLKRYTHFLEKDYANPASIQHASGQFARHNLEAARHTLADWIGADSREIIFTSGATESNHLAISGVITFQLEHGKSIEDLHIITSPLEHPSILKPIERWQKRGLRVSTLTPDSDGFLDPIDLETHIDKDTCLVTLQWANHEIGTVQPIEALGRICHDRGIPFHTDATQALGKLPNTTVNDSQARPIIDLMSGSSHKFYGPRGTGFLYLRRAQPRIRISPLMVGGGQEREIRPGTVNVPAIIAMAEAGRLAQEELPGRNALLGGLQSALESKVHRLPDVRVVGPDVSELEASEALNRKLPNTTCILIKGVQAQSLMHAMPDFAFSSGAACSSPEGHASHVLEAIDIQTDELSSAIRISLGKDNTPEEIEQFLNELPTCINGLRKLNETGITFQAEQIGEASPKSWRQWFHYLLNYVNSGASPEAQSKLPMTAQIGSKDCGDWLKISVDSQTPSKVHLQVFGGPVTVAVGAYLSSFLAYGVDLSHSMDADRISTSLSLLPEHAGFARMGEKVLTRLYEATQNMPQKQIATDGCEL